jgi:flavin reductase (DIM6/NTAB) family NADH-FMN oxidoreductase RutF
VSREGDKIGGEVFREGETGSPILESAPAFVECSLVDTLEKGDHSLFLGRIVAASLQNEPEGRPDEATLWLKDLGEKIFYGG